MARGGVKPEAGMRPGAERSRNLIVVCAKRGARSLPSLSLVSCVATLLIGGHQAPLWCGLL